MRQGRPDFLKLTFFSLVNLAEFFSTLRIRFEISLTVEIVVFSDRPGQHFRIKNLKDPYIPRYGVDIYRGRNCQAGFRFELR